jgi:hypothetical protein
VPRYGRFVTEWPRSGTKIKKAILREMIAADLKEKGTTRAPKITIAPQRVSFTDVLMAPLITFSFMCTDCADRRVSRGMS